MKKRFEQQKIPSYAWLSNQGDGIQFPIIAVVKSNLSPPPLSISLFRFSWWKRWRERCIVHRYRNTFGYYYGYWIRVGVGRARRIVNWTAGRGARLQDGNRHGRPPREIIYQQVAPPHFSRISAVKSSEILPSRTRWISTNTFPRIGRCVQLTNSKLWKFSQMENQSNVVSYNGKKKMTRNTRNIIVSSFFFK